MLPIPATSTFGRPPSRQHLDLVGVEVEVPALPLEQLRGGIVVEGDGEVLGAVDVAEHAGDGGRAAGEEEVVGVRPTGGAETDGGALADLDPADPRGVGPGVDAGVDAGIPPRERLGGGVLWSSSPVPPRGSPRGRSERTAPCRRSQTSGGRPSHRSTIAAARGSVPRASAFSSSVRVRTRSARISSISVASQKSPALSGAMAGWS